jgi:hypothetical protein
LILGCTNRSRSAITGSRMGQFEWLSVGTEPQNAWIGCARRFDSLPSRQLCAIPLKGSLFRMARGERM